MSVNIKIAIAIPTYNRNQVLIDTINEVLKQNPLPDEILIIDQTEQHIDDVEKQLNYWHNQGSIRYIKEFPPGLPKARNRAIKETTCDIIIFIDDDVILTEKFIEHHKANYVSDSKVVAVAGRVEQRLGWPDIKRPTQWNRVLDYRFFRLDSKQRVEGIANFIGCNHSIRVDFVKNIGGYDEEYIGVALREETDLALRIYLSSGLIVFDPMSSLLHLSAPNGGCRKQNSLDVSAGLSVLRFARKYQHVLKKYFYLEVWHALRISILSKKNLKNIHIMPILISKLTLAFFNTKIKKSNFL
jgi:GT2 family glycosyltransferase